MANLTKPTDSELIGSVPSTARGDRMRPTQAASLVEDASKALENDIDTVRDCLAQLAALFALDRPAAVAAQFPSLRSGGLAPWQLRHIERHVAANIERPLGLAELAALVKISSSHLCRAFKASTGGTLHGYVTGCRIRHAQSLMLTTDRSLGDIARAAGLADQAHLSRLFRRHVGDAPLSWRRKWRRAG